MPSLALNHKLRHNSSFLFCSIFLYIISPILCIPIVVVGLKKRLFGSFFFFALILASIIYLMIPSQDLYRHTINYLYWEGKPLSDIAFADLMMNGTITYIEWFMVNHSIPFDYLRFFEIIVVFLILSKIFNYQIINSNVKYTKFQLNTRLLIFILFFDFFYTAEGVRFGFALCFYLYGIHELIDYNSKIKCALFLIISGTIHLAFAVLAPISLVIYNIKLKKQYAFIAVCILFVLFGIFISKFSYLLGQRAEWYFSEKTDGVASYGGMTIFGLIGFLLPKMASFPYIYILYKNYKIENKWARMSLVWLIIAAISSSNPVLFYRTIWVFMAMGIYMLLSIESLNKKVLKPSLIKTFIVCGLLFFSINTLRYYRTIYNSPVIHRIILPAPLIFSSQTNFSKSWLTQHIRPDGSIK